MKISKGLRQVALWAYIALCTIGAFVFMWLVMAVA